MCFPFKWTEMQQFRWWLFFSLYFSPSSFSFLHQWIKVFRSVNNSMHECIDLLLRAAFVGIDSSNQGHAESPEVRRGLWMTSPPAESELFISRTTEMSDVAFVQWENSKFMQCNKFRSSPTGVFCTVSLRIYVIIRSSWNQTRAKLNVTHKSHQTAAFRKYFSNIKTYLWWISALCHV